MQDSTNSRNRPSTTASPEFGLACQGGTELILWIQKQYAHEVRMAYESCWHMSDGDPTAYAWDAFGGCGCGLAIKTTPEAMISALQRYMRYDGPTYFSAVQYIDHQTCTIQPENLIAAALAVSICFREEREARVLIHPEGHSTEFLAALKGPLGPLIVRNPASGKTDESSTVGGANGSNGAAIVLSVNPETFVQEILLGPKMEDTKRTSLLRLIQGHRLDHKLRR